MDNLVDLRLAIKVVEDDSLSVRAKLKQKKKLHPTRKLANVESWHTFLKSFSDLLETVLLPCWRLDISPRSVESWDGGNHVDGLTLSLSSHAPTVRHSFKLSLSRSLHRKTLGSISDCRPQKNVLLDQDPKAGYHWPFRVTLGLWSRRDSNPSIRIQCPSKLCPKLSNSDCSSIWLRTSCCPGHQSWNLQIMLLPIGRCLLVSNSY